MDGMVHSIETMGTVDGPGIRFVVFLQGCPLRCRYCHNPDTWVWDAGTVRSTDELLAQYNRYLPYFRNGGITVSGGEPLCQMEFVTELFTEARKRGIHTCLDTSGITFDKNDEAKKKNFYSLTKVTDLVMLDIKHMDSEQHIKLTGSSVENVLDFALFLDGSGTEIWIRHVLVPGWTDDRESLTRLGTFTGRLKNLKAIDLLPYHKMGKIKYDKLNMTYPLSGVPECQPEEIKRARNIILEAVRKARLEEENKCRK